MIDKRFKDSHFEDYDMYDDVDCWEDNDWWSDECYMEPDGRIARCSPNSYWEVEHYGEFAGTYAQDVRGFSDELINDVFEGDPDLYWNID